MTGTIVVVGAGLAGLRTAEKLRTAGWTGAVRVIGAEDHLPYNRPPLTKEALRDGLGHEHVELRRRGSVGDVEWLLGREAVRVDLAGRTVHLRDGSEMTYDGLVVATGVEARRLDLGPARRHVVRTVDDAVGLHAALTAASRVVVVGAGFIGCEVACTARLLGCEVTVVDPMSSPLELQLGPLAGTEVGRRHRAAGIRFRLGRVVAGIEESAGGSAVTLDDGTILGADVVVEAVGSVPRVGLLEGHGLDLSDGILCDADLHPVADGMPVPEVVAVGDVARVPQWLLGGEARRIEHWSTAVDTAGHAARSLLATLTGTEVGAAYAPVPSFWSDQADLKIQSFGVPSAGLADVRVLDGDLAGSVALGYHRDGRLVGVVLLDLTAEQMRFRSLLVDSAQVPVTSA
ncbi:NAD(P)/FAD-dependent oxidoreductase [Nocardioides sediminis]|uniref:NAD(P)/FAD-dependent oxidoreductase n=1 Tax=Nocardioides sediminis TaxID=433648 RepID=UPI000D311EEC|nr:FAD-dependent oxidoreductase [Nocardioides sediminis]